jgi:PAS domain S-box-containing protein
LGWDEQEIVGQHFAEFTHPDDLERTLQVFANIFNEPLVIPYEYRFRHKDGSYRWFAWTAAFEDGKIYASGRHTTTEREQAEALRQSQKMEAVGHPACPSLGDAKLDCHLIHARTATRGA